jgi:hypothetical protein
MGFPLGSVLPPWSPLRQFPLVITFLAEVVVLLVLDLWKDVMNLLVEVLDLFNRTGCMIFLGLSVGGLYR